MPILYDKGTRVRIVESSGDKCAGGLGVVVDISDTALFQYTVKVDGEREFRNYRIGEIEKVEKRDPLVGQSVKVLDSESTYFIGKTGKVVEVRDDWEIPYRVHFPGEGHVWFKAHQLEDEAAARNPEVGESFEEKDSEESVGGDLSVGDKVKIMHPKGGHIVCSGLTGTVDEVLPGDCYDYVVAFSGGGKFGYRRDELVPVVEEPGVALIGKTVQIKPGVMFAGEFGTVAGVHDSGNNTYHVDFGTGERIKHYYPLEYLEILPSVGDRVKINEGHIRAGDIGRVTEVELDSGSPWRVVFDSTESVNYRYFVEDLEVVPEDTETLYVPGGGMDWSDSVAVPIVVPEAPVKALEDEFVRIRLEDGQVVVESLGTPFDEVRIASGLLHGLIRQWHEREEGANRRTAMDMLDLSGLFGELPEEDQAVVDSVVAMLKRRDWI